MHVATGVDRFYGVRKQYDVAMHSVFMTVIITIPRPSHVPVPRKTRVLFSPVIYKITANFIAFDDRLTDPSSCVSADRTFPRRRDRYRSMAQAVSKLHRCVLTLVSRALAENVTAVRSIYTSNPESYLGGNHFQRTLLGVGTFFFFLF